MDISIEVAGDTARERVRVLSGRAYNYTWEGDNEFELDVLELDRLFIARAGNHDVGQSATLSLSISVPGGSRIEAAGITWVGVLPTHRRRGILSSLMRTQLRGIRSLGRESVAILWATEPGIYERYGFGVASWHLDIDIPRTHNRLRATIRDDDESLALEYSVPSDSLFDFSRVESEMAARRPGMPIRDERFWRRLVFDPPALRRGQSEKRCLIARDSRGDPRGYALFAAGMERGGILPANELSVHEVLASDRAASLAIWKCLLSTDLIGSFRAWNVPVDDLLLHLLEDPRAAQPRLSDSLHARLIDVPRALQSREYSFPIDIVIAVDDELCPWNARRWRLRAAPTGVSCVATTDPADLELGVAVLGSIYLGGVSLRAMADAGRVIEHTSGAVDEVSWAFLSDRAPYCPFYF